MLREIMEKNWRIEYREKHLKSFQRVPKNSKNSIKYTIALFFNNLKHRNIMDLIMKKQQQQKNNNNNNNIKQVYNIKKNSHFFYIVYIIKSIK